VLCEEGGHFSVLGPPASVLLGEDEDVVREHVELTLRAFRDLRVVALLAKLGRETRGPFVVAGSDGAVEDANGRHGATVPAATLETGHDTEVRYDALILVSFGGPEGPDDVMPFLENVTRGRGVPRARLAQVAEHYHRFGGVSPINEQNRALIAALRSELAAHSIDLPIYFGNRNWRPFVADAVSEMRDDGVQRALAIFTSAYSSYSGCRQYREDLYRARREVGPDAPEVDKIRVFHNHAGFIEANVDRVRAALDALPGDEPVHIAFTAHSIPAAMARCCAYERQLGDTARLVAAAVGVTDWALAYQSRSGPPHVPWLGPDVGEHLEEVSARGVRNVVVSPIGFVSDHLEVVYDLDTEAAETAARLGLRYARAGTAGTHPAFVAGLRELVEERLHSDAPLGTCGPDCCRPGTGAPSPWEEAGLAARV
jgi:protoporphyrin/coproporphyrin ferrochelatase